MVVLGCNEGRSLVDIQRHDRKAPEAITQVPQRQHHIHASVAHDVEQPLGRETDVQRDIRGVDFEYG